MVGHQNKQNIIIIFGSQQLYSCSERTSVFLKKNMFCFFFKKTCFFFKNKYTVEKKNKGQNGFFSKPPVFKVNIHNLSQFVNHTVTLVQNKNNNERISLK